MDSGLPLNAFHGKAFDRSLMAIGDNCGIVIPREVPRDEVTTEGSTTTRARPFACRVGAVLAGTSLCITATSCPWEVGGCDSVLGSGT